MQFSKKMIFNRKEKLPEKKHTEKKNLFIQKKKSNLYCFYTFYTFSKREKKKHAKENIDVNKRIFIDRKMLKQLK
jgi:hypothetical protein